MKIKNDVTKPTLYVIGISHKNADATIRGLFSLSPTNKRNILMQGKLEGVENLLINSTCNRTEIIRKDLLKYSRLMAMFWLTKKQLNIFLE